MQSSQTIVLLHGHGVDASIWDGVYAELFPDYTLFRPDFSRLIQYQTIEGYTDELHRQLVNGQAGQVILIGHSMGGYIALAFAEKYPATVVGLGLFHSTAFADDATKKEQRQKAIHVLTEHGTPTFMEELMPKLVADAYAPEKVQRLIERFSYLPAEALMAGMKAIASRPDRTAVLRETEYPVLILMGRQDQVIPYEKAVEQVSLLQNGFPVTIEGAGHLAMLETPEEAVQALRAFLTSVIQGT